jgi:PPM family protein phosphatase
MLSDTGLLRKGNEDTCAASLDLGAFVVCDGMGGAAAGEVASHLAAETFLKCLEPADASPSTRLTNAVEAANNAVFEKARQQPELAGMGTTLVALLHVALDTAKPDPEAHSLWLAHVGDSRCYLYRSRELSQLTDDHSLVEEQVRAGQLTPYEAARSPMRNYITRAVGSQSTVEIDLQPLTPQPGDLYLLASDGLNREITDADIATVLADIPSPPTTPYLAAAAKALITAANHHGGRDNITVLLIAFPQGVERRKPRRT